MHSTNETVLRELAQRLQQGEHCWLISITSTWGSSPRPAGSLLLWSEHSGAVGSLSGGCVEDNLLEALAQGQFSSHIQQQRYGISAEEASRLRLPCGGSMELLLEPIAATPEHQQQAQHIVALLDDHQGFTRSTDLTSGHVEITPAKPHKPELSHTQFNNYLGPRFRLLLVGANQVAEYLAEFTHPLDFDIFVCDPRPNAFDHWPHPFTHNLQDMPDDVVRAWASDPLCAIVTLSHDPRVDDMALMEALTTNAFYIGAMGSKRTTEARIQRLQQLDLNNEQIAKLHAPVGLDIGSKTPAEIALSIAAHLLQQRGKSH